MDYEIVFRTLNKGDAESLFLLTSNEHIARYMRFDTHTRLEEAELLLTEYLSENAFAMEIEGKLVGVFVLKKEQDSSFSMSIFLDEPYWNQGYSSSALCYMTQYATERLGAKSLVAYVVADNIGSSRVLIKNGFSEREVLHFDDLPCGLIVYEWNTSCD